MVTPDTLAGFEKTFRSDDDPWRTFTDADEAHKRAAIVRGLGVGVTGRVLELAADNGSNSVALVAHALRLDATEGTATGIRLTAQALAGTPRARSFQLTLAGGFPRTAYEAIVVAELLYYMTPRAMAALARDTARVLPNGGRLILTHHRVDFHDFAQHANGIHARYLAASGAHWHGRVVAQTGRWIVESFLRGSG